jgi:hypothetical protein
MKKKAVITGAIAIVSAVILLLAAMRIFEFGLFGKGSDGRSETILELDFDTSEDADWIILKGSDAEGAIVGT